MGLSVPVTVEVNLDANGQLHDTATTPNELGDQLVEAAINAIPTPADLVGTPLERLSSAA